MAIDWEFIREKEGFETALYVPENKDGTPKGQSGVTVGSGIDLGQWTEARFKKMGVPAKTLTKLSAYFGKKKEKAQEYLAANPLELDNDEAEELTSIVKGEVLKGVKSWYNKNNTSGNDWSDLTDEQQTVTTSVLFQYKPGHPDLVNFNRQLKENDWPGILDNLRDFRDDYGPRRISEAQYLVGAKTDGYDGPNTQLAVDNYVAKLKGDPVGAKIASTVVGGATEAVEKVSQFDMSSFFEGIASYARDNATTPSRASQEPTEGVTEDTEFSKEEEAWMDSVLNASKEGAASKEEEESVEGGTEQDWTPEEIQFLERATGTVEKEAPVVVQDQEEGGEDASKDPTYGIF